jgi:polyisoprenoid-binding protein YceI
MKKLALVAVSLVVLFASVSFAKKTKKAADPAPAAALTKMDVTGSLKWTGFGVGKSHTGDIALKSGFVEMKGSDLVGGTFVLDMTTLKTADSPKLEGHLKSQDFFDVTKFNQGTFKITKVEALKDVKAGAPTHKITGDLTIKDKTHTEEFLATINKKGKGFEAVAAAEIKDRTQYDIVYNSGKFKAISALGDKLIQDNIKVELAVKTK